MTLGRVVALVAGLGAVAYGALGGEYSSIDMWKLERQVGQEQRAIDRLRIELDSLAPYAEALETDSATQERVARERFGMVRSGEVGYRLEQRRP